MEAASSIIISASHVRIFHLGPSLQRLAKYSAAASALANATVALLTSTGRGISRLSLAARERGSDRLPRKYVSLGRQPRAYAREARDSRRADQPPHVEVHGLRRRFLQANASSPAQGSSPRLQLLPNLRPHLPDKPQLPKHNRRIVQQ